jgi:hypothetical protein
MKRVFLVLAGVTGLLLAALVYERVFVEQTLGPAALAAMSALGAVVIVLLVLARLYETRHRETINNLTIAAVSTVVSYLAIDLITGFFLIQPLSPPLVADQYRHHKMVPNSLSSFHQKDFQYVQRVNNLGMRGADVVEAKPAGTYRILMLGDSFTMGKGVEDQQTFSVLLESALRRRVGACGGPAIEVLNGGVDSYAPILSYLELTRDLGVLSPDMIVLNLDVSDLVQEAAYRQIAVYGPNGEIVGVPQAERAVSLTERIREWTQRHLFITRALLYYLLERSDYREFSVRSVVEQANMAVAAHTLAEDTEPREEQWRNIFDSLRRIQRYADAHGSRFLLSVYPWAHQVSDTEWIPGRYAFMPEGSHPSDKSRETVRAMAAADGIEVIDLFPAFRAYQGAAPLFFQHDMHWTTAGHEVAAAGLEAYLAGNYLDSWCQ